MGNAFKTCVGIREIQSNRNEEEQREGSVDRAVRETSVIVAGLVKNSLSIAIHHDPSEEMHTFDCKQRAIIVCNHLFRLHTTNKFISFKDISSIIIEYYNNCIKYNGKFIDKNCGNGMVIINQNEIAFHTDISLGHSYKSAKLDTPIYSASKTIVVWKIKMWNKMNLTMYDAFGVVSNECDNIGRAPWGGLVDFYGISAAGKKVWHGTTFKFVEDEKHTTVIEKGQTVCMELDCSLSRIVWKSDGKIIYGPMNLPERDAWYPAISVGFPTWKYNVILIK